MEQRFLMDSNAVIDYIAKEFLQMDKISSIR